MELELTNLLKECGLGGFRYVPFPPPVFRVAAMPDPKP